MARPGDELWNPVTETRVVFVATAHDSGGRELVVDWIMRPGQRLVAAAHLHPGGPGVEAEHWQVLAGSAGYRVGRDEGTGTSPHEWSVPANTAHVHPWNVGGDELHVRQSVRPPEPDLDLLDGVERYFETLTALSQRGRADRKGNIRNPLQNALTLYELLLPGTYLARVPKAVQRIALGGLAAVARRAGLQAYHEPERTRPG
jgi:hypothetical protein